MKRNERRREKTPEPDFSPELDSLSLTQFLTVVKAPTTKVMTSDNSGSQVQLIGDTPAYFRFDSNPSTGYKLIVDDAAANGIFSFD